MSSQHQVNGIDYADLIADLKDGETPEDYIHPEWNRLYTRQELAQARYAAREERRDAAAEEELEAIRLRREEAAEQAIARAEAEAAEDQFEAGRQVALRTHLW